MTAPTLIPTKVYTYAGVTHGVYRANTGDMLPRHKHQYAHLTMCVAGRIVVRKEGVVRELLPSDNPINLRENEWHEIEALEDGTIFINQFAL